MGYRDKLVSANGLLLEGSAGTRGNCMALLFQASLFSDGNRSYVLSIIPFDPVRLEIHLHKIYVTIDARLEETCRVLTAWQ